MNELGEQPSASELSSQAGEIEPLPKSRIDAYESGDMFEVIENRKKLNELVEASNRHERELQRVNAREMERLTAANQHMAFGKPTPDGTPGMIRPTWESVANTGGFILCNCGSTFQTREIIREHWQDGHFDYVKEEPTPDGPWSCDTHKSGGSSGSCWQCKQPDGTKGYEVDGSRYIDVCPLCESEDIENVGDKEYNDLWFCNTCKKEFGSFKMKALSDGTKGKERDEQYAASKRYVEERDRQQQIEALVRKYDVVFPDGSYKTELPDRLRSFAKDLLTLVGDEND